MTTMAKIGGGQADVAIAAVFGNANAGTVLARFAHVGALEPPAGPARRRAPHGLGGRRRELHQRFIRQRHLPHGPATHRQMRIGARPARATEDEPRNLPHDGTLAADRRSRAARGA